jgi:hypothetical protein
MIERRRRLLAGPGQLVHDVACRLAEPRTPERQARQAGTTSRVTLPGSSRVRIRPSSTGTDTGAAGTTAPG